MPKPRYPGNTKVSRLIRSGTLNPKPDEVADQLFLSNDFFDPHDLMQVKYEMLRRVDVEGQSVTKAAGEFGFSRRHFYEIKRRFEKEGLPSFIAEKRGPRKAHKLTSEIMDFIEISMGEDSSLKSEFLAEMIKKKFKVEIHPRSIERGIDRRKKNQKHQRKPKSIDGRHEDNN